jgi:hypothetical protein
MQSKNRIDKPGAALPECSLNLQELMILFASRLRLPVFCPQHGIAESGFAALFQPFRLGRNIPLS